MSAIESWMLAYLLNALWQVPVVFGAAWAMARLARPAGPETEHRIWVGALLAEVALPACPLQVGAWVRTAWAGLLAWSTGTGGGRVRVGFGESFVGVPGGLRFPPGLLATIAAAYGVGVLYFAGRLAWGLWRTRQMRLRSECLPLPVPVAIGQLQVRVSREVAGPVTVGAWRSVVLLPSGFRERVTDEDLRVVLAHEGAHVRRLDFAKNGFYGLLTLPIAFHPVLWFTRTRLAESREMVCDAMAAEAVAGRERYAGSLLRLASMRVRKTPEKMLHAIGIFDANSFEGRIMNLTMERMEMKGARRVVVAVACGLLAFGTAISALALRVGAPATQSAGQNAPGEHMARVSGGVMAGQVLSRVNPVYPPEAKEAGIVGAVVLAAIIGKDGVIENLQVVSGPEQLQTSALDAVRQWTYKPYLLNGEPTEVQTTITVNYSLAR